MSRGVGISWGFKHEQQQVCQEPKTSSTADAETDEEIWNNKEQNKGSVCKLSTINGPTVIHNLHKLDATGVSIKWAGYWDVIAQSILTKFLTSLSINQNAYAHDCCLWATKNNCIIYGFNPAIETVTTIHGVRQGVGNELYATSCILFRALQSHPEKVFTRFQGWQSPEKGPW